MSVNPYNYSSESIPLSRSTLLDYLEEYRRPNDKISDMIQKGELISLRRGLYTFDRNTSPYLIANHLRGPSYVTMESALSHWGLIPERVFEVASATIKTSKRYETDLGRFSYFRLSTPYYSFGIRHVNLSMNQSVLMASPEKALCDYIVLTSGINLRSISQTLDFLVQDLRIDEEALHDLDTEMIESWLTDAPKRSSLEMLVKTLHRL